MRHARSALLLAATFFLVGSVGAWTESVPDADSNPPVESTAALDEILDALGLDALAVDMFMKIEGVKGESTAGRGHDDWIVIESFGWGATRPSGATGQARRRGSTSFSDLSVTKKVDGSSPDLYLACASGKHIPKAELVVRKAGSSEAYFRIVLEDAMITSVGVSHSAGDDVPVEEVSLNYGKIHWEYSPHDDTGPGSGAAAGWDVKAGKGA